MDREIQNIQMSSFLNNKILNKQKKNKSQILDMKKKKNGFVAVCDYNKNKIK